MAKRDKVYGMIALGPALSFTFEPVLLKHVNEKKILPYILLDLPASNYLIPCLQQLNVPLVDGFGSS